MAVHKFNLHFRRIHLSRSSRSVPHTLNIRIDQSRSGLEGTSYAAELRERFAASKSPSWLTSFAHIFNCSSQLLQKDSAQVMPCC